MSTTVDTGLPAMEATPGAEAGLVVAARTGSSAAIGRLYHLHAAALFETVARVTGSRAEAEDVVHDLFLGLPELLRRYEHSDRLREWLRTVAVRRALSARRKDRRRAALLERAEPEAFGRAPADPAWRVDLGTALAQLPESLRIVFVLRAIEGYSHREIASLTDTAPGTSRVRYLRALRHLRRILE